MTITMLTLDGTKKIDLEAQSYVPADPTGKLGIMRGYLICKGPPGSLESINVFDNGDVCEMRNGTVLGITSKDWFNKLIVEVVTEITQR